MAFAGDDELAALQNVHPALRDSLQLPHRSLAAELPDSILDVSDNLLFLVDAPTFASLAVLNRHWHSKCSTTRLYAYHLARSTSSAKQHDYNATDLTTLKRRFAQVAKQNLFPAYRPRLSTYHIVAPAVLSPSSTPHGEFFNYSFSSRARYLAVYSACRLFVLDVENGQPVVKRALSIKQRPLAVDISDDGSKLAMLVSELKLKVFSLLSDRAAQSHSFIMEEPARTICLTPDGTLVAAAQEDCIELFALTEIPGRVPRRVVACEGVSHVAFSLNGKLLLGSHTRSAKASTTVISAPEDMAAGMGEEDEDDAPKEDMAIMWISRPLFPTAFEKTTHAALLPGDDLTLLAYDEPADSFGILDANLMSFSSSLLAVPAEFLQPSSLPCVTAGGDVAAIPFSRSGIRIVSLSDLSAGDQHESSAKQRWIPFTKAISRARWQLDAERQERLFATGAGKSAHPQLMQASDDEQRETGSIFAFDFDYHVEATRAADIIINLDSIEVETLQVTDDSDDVAISIQKRPASRASDRPKNAPLARSVTAARRKQRAKVPAVPEIIGPQDVEIPSETGAEVPEEQLLDEVYHPSQPRPQSTLIRSASTIAARREREPPRFLANAQPRLRRAGDPSEIPDESDADNWVPPPPAYDGGREDSNRRRSDVRGSRLPPVPPERSPNRPKLTLNTSTSTPDLHASSSRAQAEQAGARSRADVKKPNKLQRPKQKRVKSAVENARKSLVMSSQSVRRAFSGPAHDEEDKPLPERPTPQPPVPQPSVRSTRPRPPQPSPARKPVPAPAAAPLPAAAPAPAPVPAPVPTPRASRPRPVSLAAEPEAIPKRRSVLQRPLSLASSGILESRPANRRSISQPLPIANSPHAIPYPGSPDSPSLPEASQITSLHRRQTSGSISSMNSNLSGMAPRAAAGAVRSGTNPNSPWASSTMLATLSEGPTTDAAVQPAVSGRPLSGQFSSRTASNPPRRLQDARRSLNASGLAMHQRTASYSSTDSPSRPSTSPPQADGRGLDGRTTREKRPETSGSNGGRLTTIQSIASTIKERSRSRGSPSARAAGVQRSNSKRDKQAGVTSLNIADAKKKGKGFFAKWKKTLFSSLESV